MSTVRTIYQCDMCGRQYGATREDPAPRQLNINIAGTCVRVLKAPRNNGYGEACKPCTDRLKAIVGAAWDALLAHPEATS